MKRPNRRHALRAVDTLLRYIGEDTSRAGLLDTPRRVLDAWLKDWGQAYDDDWVKEQMASIHKGRFPLDGAQGMVCVDSIAFDSHCEHHMAPFRGLIDVAYIPNDCILGLSKFPRIAAIASRRLQVQERLTTEVAEMAQIATQSQHVAVCARAVHSCMTTRGVRQHSSVTTTTELRGAFYDDPATRSEFLAHVRSVGAMRPV